MESILDSDEMMILQTMFVRGSKWRPSLLSWTRHSWWPCSSRVSGVVAKHTELTHTRTCGIFVFSQ